MRALLLTAVIAFVAGGIVFAAWYPVSGREPLPPSSTPAFAPTGLAADATLEERVAALEAALVIERDARQLMQEELFYLGQDLDDTDTEPDVSRQLQAVGSVEVAQTGEGSGRFGRRSSRDPAERRARLVENGFSPQQADEILRRESELQMESLQARYEARLNGERASIPSSSAVLREEMGDEAYSRYLEANGRPVSVTVSTIYEGSPALNAGLRPGDEIVRYDGNRVFSMNDISRYIMDGAPGENVTIEVTRDGMIMQLAIPRGPLGVSGGRRSSR